MSGGGSRCRSACELKQWSLPVQACDAAASGDAELMRRVLDSGAFDTALLDVPRIHLGF